MGTWTGRLRAPRAAPPASSPLLSPFPPLLARPGLGLRRTPTRPRIKAGVPATFSKEGRQTFQQLLIRPEYVPWDGGPSPCSDNLRPHRRAFLSHSIPERVGGELLRLQFPACKSVLRDYYPQEYPRKRADSASVIGVMVHAGSQNKLHVDKWAKMAVFRQGDHVWVDLSFNKQHNVPIGAVVKDSTKPNKILVEDDEGKEHWIEARDFKCLQLMNPSSAQGVEDMILLGDLNEAGIVHNLLIRYQKHKIYTYVGAILVAVNPYQVLPIYTMDQIQLYYNRKIGELPPHVFAIADSCYFNMKKNKRDQCCIISGESGAGKTETTKLILQFLAIISGQHSSIEQQVLEANPILEAFGNAKTVRNDNSSRFGKYIEIHFNKNGVIEGAQIEHFLLEKSRVCRQAPEERNYHIFYCMLMGMNEEQKKLLSLGTVSEYNYLTMGNCISCEGRNDVKDYASLRSAMKVLMFSDSENWDISKLLAAILHLGNVEFSAAISDNLDCSYVVETPQFLALVKLLEVKVKELQACLTSHYIVVRGEGVSRPLNFLQASDRRDAFVKGIYGHLFLWIVNKINAAIFKGPSKDPQNVRRSIGLLDIFGFENFHTNSFEQLCINFANEHLQQLFVRHVFKMEQEEYHAESIPWNYIHFNDNQPTLDLLALKPMNIISLMDEESKFPKGTDATMLQKMNHLHSNSKVYVAPKNTHDMKFGIVHFAGLVHYQAEGFLEKNRDVLSADIIKLVYSSQNKFLNQIFQLEPSQIKLRQGTIRLARSTDLLSKNADATKRPSTLASQFKQSLDQLMKILNNCQPHFIRCIKPNEFKKPMLFDRQLCIQQLHYSGMLETVKIRKSGYSIRYTFEDFFQRYKILLPGATRVELQDKPRQATLRISENWVGKDENWKMGKTKIFLKDYQDIQLEVQRSQVLNKNAVIVQKAIRGYKYRKEFLSQKRAAVTLQAAWRGYACRRNYKMILLGFERLQAFVRRHQLTKQYKATRAKVIQFQALCRGYLIRQKVAEKKRAVVVIQAHARGMIARQNFNRRKIEHQSRVGAEKLPLEKKEHLRLIVGSREAKEETNQLQKERLAVLEGENRKNQMDQPTKKRASIYDPVNDTEMVEKVFGFLPIIIGGQKGQAPQGFEDLETTTQKLTEVDLDTIPMSVEPEEDMDDLDEYTFPKFAATYFQKAATHTHIRRPLHHPLLYHEEDEDFQIALVIWKIILRFMGEFPEPQLFAKSSNPQGTLVTRQIRDSLGKKNNARFLTDSKTEKNSTWRKKNGDFSTMTLKRSSRLTGEVAKKLSSGEEAFKEESPITERPMSNLEKVHFIIRNGIQQPNIRDEIYCQICKQLSENYNKNSFARGWILLCLCLGCFPPSEKFTKYLLNFISKGPSGYRSFCTEQLRRTYANGVRTEPPNSLELQAVKSKARIPVNVTLMNGESLTIAADSASSSREVCQHIADKLRLKDLFGFSIYVAIYDKFWSLGGGHDHLMDAISQCEQMTKEKGENERQSPWRFFFRKEIFTPWHDFKQDPVSTELIYHQIIRGFRFGEYRLEKEEDLVEMAAKYCYIEFGSCVRASDIQKTLPFCIPAKVLKTKSQEQWVNLVTAACAKAPYIQNLSSPLSVKEQIVSEVCFQWPLLFSKLFEVTKISGPSLNETQLILAINWKGICFLDKSEKKLLDLTFPEVIGIVTNRAPQVFKQNFTLSTLNTEEYVFVSSESVAITELIAMFLEGLKKKSMYAMATRDKKSTDDPTILMYKKGDLLILTKDEGIAPNDNWILAHNDRTDKTGAVSIEDIYIIPTVVKPTPQMMSLLAMSPEDRKLATQNAQPQKYEEKELKEKPYTLEEYSYEYFRLPEKETINKAMFPKARGKSQLWEHSWEPLRQPLLKRVHANVDLRDVACQTFAAILKYMGDYPSKQARDPVELTDQIFAAAIQEATLRDEVYCQIMKQLTKNTNSYSLERGWQLLWLCTGLFPPSKTLLPHTQKFIESRRKNQPIAPDCSRRIQRVMRTGPRKWPPHQAEVEAIQQNIIKICHKVYFPNDTEEIFEVGANTKVQELCQNISTHLQLNSWEGCSLFVKISDKVISQNEKDFFFDSLRQVSDWIRKTKPTKEGTTAPLYYHVYFMRKLWLNVSPGKDLKADTILHYHQELPKYLRGFHKCSREDAIQLAGLIYKVQFDKDRSQLATVSRILKDLVPENLIHLMSSEEWKKNIFAAYNKCEEKTVDEAKVAFLKLIYRWPTFGSAFFEVKQCSEPTYPEIILIAINKHGLQLIHPKTKELLNSYPFTKISSWSSGSTYFHLVLGNLVRANRLLCETSLGYKMDDLLTSYVQLLLSAVNKQKNSRALD
ncbi:LOW QUALITY PROTEIN: unconventional myosin-VIIb [Notamacropus eugenii]|uniref:LOW QUALITY PROTEIN: unconventional myosin-VIIb n=1 Tax=Notamacropus eugenii TaxID=9315 RepID=UPI003B67232B